MMERTRSLKKMRHKLRRAMPYSAKTQRKPKRVTKTLINCGLINTHLRNFSTFLRMRYLIEMCSHGLNLGTQLFFQNAQRWIWGFQTLSPKGWANRLQHLGGMSPSERSIHKAMFIMPQLTRNFPRRTRRSLLFTDLLEQERAPWLVS